MWESSCAPARDVVLQRERAHRPNVSVMEHIEIYRDHRIWAWTEKDGGAWKASYTIDNETLQTGLGRRGLPEEKVLQDAIEIARKRLDEWPRE